MTNLATTTALNAKINEVTNKMLNITNLATTTALTAVVNRILMLVISQKTDNKTRISEIENKITTNHHHDRYITAQVFNKLTSENFNARLKQTNLASKNNITNFVKNTDFGNKL